MRQWLVPILVLSLVGSAAALPLLSPAAELSFHERFDASLALCAGASPCATAATRAHTDALVAELATLPRDVASTVETAIAIQGYAPASIAQTRSPSLEAALLRLYAIHDINVDEREVARQADALAPADALSLTRIVDAVADAQVASARILAPEDVAFLQDDLRTKMLQLTLQGDTSLVDVLARADMAHAAAAAQRVASATVAASDLLPATGCERVLDLPFVVVGAPCDDVYAASETVFILIDYGGNDVYLNNAGAGIAGVGVGLAIDQGAGADVYDAAAGAQGSAIAGVGILVDEGGSDSYDLAQFGQGFGAAGIGLLYDQGAGDDRYTSDKATSIATKAGGLGGIGILRDDGGSDLYQVGGLDGFVYGAAGGLGLMLEYGDAPGDLYLAEDQHIILLGSDLGNFVGPVQVSAEVSATAILFEEAGDTVYVCGEHVRQGCQGAGGVGGLALHLDLAGDDSYSLGQSITPVQLGVLPVFPSGQGIAYGEGSAPPGPGVGVLRDFGGNDAYVADRFAQGYATGGLGALLDEGSGIDLYMDDAPLVGSRANGATWADGIALGVGVDDG